ncbi:unnamed protein product [Protopolystoma xenopodis]|uniref:Tubulin/FtsZ 2-layer sandwich domain-containing protein n=1 Tax=Protopolystoma xenopodis TaxID=117903 RepID=A0A3S5CIF0_9PLAT|nr:unnamed protein product [Protopolystoma xenopodis]
MLCNPSLMLPSTDRSSVTPTLLETTRRLVEATDRFQGFFTFSSLAGGSGSSLLCSFLDASSCEFGRHSSIQLCMVPGGQLSSGPTEPYNTVLSLNKLNEASLGSDLICLLDNAALYTICSEQLSVRRPSFTSVNRVIAPMVAGLSAGLRFQVPASYSLAEYLTNLVPFPKVKFPLISYSPFGQAIEDRGQVHSVDLMTQEVFAPANRTISVPSGDELQLASCLVYRGDVSPADAIRAMKTVKRKAGFRVVEWCPTGFKVSFTPQPAICLPGHGPTRLTRSLTLMTNSSCIQPLFTGLLADFDLLFRKRAFVHWFAGEGMEEAEFLEARSGLLDVLDDLDMIFAQASCENTSASTVGGPGTRSHFTLPSNGLETRSCESQLYAKQTHVMGDSDYAFETNGRMKKPSSGPRIPSLSSAKTGDGAEPKNVKRLASLFVDTGDNCSKPVTTMSNFTQVRCASPRPVGAQLPAGTIKRRELFTNFMDPSTDLKCCKTLDSTICTGLHDELNPPENVKPKSIRKMESHLASAKQIDIYTQLGFELPAFSGSESTADVSEIRLDSRSCA